MARPGSGSEPKAKRKRKPKPTRNSNPYGTATEPLPPLTVTGRLDRLRASFDEHGVDAELYPAQAIVTLLDAITSKLILDRLVGIRAGHNELLAMLHRIWGQIEQELEHSVR